MKKIYQEALEDVRKAADEWYDEEVLRENMTVEEQALKYGMDYETFRDDDS